METFYPFIYEPKEKKKEEQIPLYVELIPRVPDKKIVESEEESKIIIIEII